jgi:hypothetical protein
VINVHTLGALLRTLQSGEVTGRALTALQPLAPTQAVKPIASESARSAQTGARDAGSGDARASEPLARNAADLRPAARGPQNLPAAGADAQSTPAGPATTPGPRGDPAVVVNLAGPSGEASSTAESVQVRGAAPAEGALPLAPLPTLADAAEGAASLRLSGAAYLVDALVRLPGGEPIRAAGPLASTPPTPDALAAQLRQSITQSGVFYESHLAGWALQGQPEAPLRLEPQATWSALLTTGPGPEPDRVAPGAIPSGAAPQPPAGVGAADAVPALVRQQIDVLETGQILWRGDLWPGQPAQIEIDEDVAARSPGALPVWRTRIALSLPGLGELEARLALSGNRLTVDCVVPEPASAARVSAAVPALVEALATRALDVAPVVIRDGRPR